MSTPSTQRNNVYIFGEGLDMNAALERVIAEQQDKIDWLERSLELSGKTVTKEVERQELFYGLVARLINLTPADGDRYWNLRSEIYAAMARNGFCHYCETIGCSGECEQ